MTDTTVDLTFLFVFKSTLSVPFPRQQLLAGSLLNELTYGLDYGVRTKSSILLNIHNCYTDF